jgi:hypothetical protein
MPLTFYMLILYPATLLKVFVTSKTFLVEPLGSLFIYFVVLGLELRAYTLNHSTGPFL